MCRIETLVDKSLKESHADKLVDGYDSEAKSVTTEIDKTNVSENGSLCEEIAHITTDNTGVRSLFGTIKIKYWYLVTIMQSISPLLCRKRFIIE
ncbi:hypothetical protein JTB14_020254 [Gonioctena quinquepunctata]|nr:hypothetical protein JTB14_020254 [Gonioctena quinquepunctata]